MPIINGHALRWSRTSYGPWSCKPANRLGKETNENQRVDRFQRAGLPGRDLLQHRVGDGADQVGRDVNTVEIAQMADDLAGGHAAGVHRNDLVVEPREAAL